MIQNFDLFNHPESPNFTLCNPDYTEISSIIAYNRKPTLRFNDSSSLSCVVYAKSTNIDYQVVDLAFYDLIKTKRLILVENIGYFQIQNVNETDDGIEKYKEITAISIQNDMGFKTMSWFDGTFKFYDALDISNTIMGKIMARIPDWTIDTISSDLLTKYRTFESVNKTLLDFILSDVSEAYECIFLFDFLNRTIKVKSIADLIANPYKTTIYFSFKNLLKKFQIEELSDDIVTALSVFGQDLDIRQVNPLGTSYIYNFSHFMTLEWMTQDLIDAITAWQSAITSAQPTYAGHLSSLQSGKADLLVSESALLDLQGDLVSNENIRSARIEQGIDYSDINIIIAGIQSDIVEKQEEIDAQTAINDSIIEDMVLINTSLSFASNFTADQLLVLDKYIYEQDYTNTYYIVTDLMNPVDIQNAAQELYNEGINALARMSQPRYTFKIDSANFMFIKDFAIFTSQFRLGCQVTVELDDDVFAYPTLLEIQYNFDDPNDFALTFSDRFKLSDPVSAFEEIISDSHASASRSAVNWNKLNEFSNQYKDEVSDFLDNAFDVAKKAIINSTDQSQTWDASGMTFRKAENNTYADEQIKIINNQIVFTDDFWNSLKTVIGKIALSGGGTAYGVAAEVIVGRLLAGVNLIITNAGNTFRIDENGFSFVTVSGETETVVDLKDYIIGSLDDLSTTIQAQIDGKITSYYQSTAPYGEYINIATSNTDYSLYCSREGDIWFDTDVSNSFRYTKTANGSNFDFTWEEISGVPDSLYDALDGKRQIFTTTPTVPYDIGDLWVQGSDGDIYACSVAKTSAQTYSVSDWSLASKYTDDTTVENFITGTYVTDQANLQGLIDGKVNTFYQSTLAHTEYTNVANNATYNVFVGDIWYNTGYTSSTSGHPIAISKTYMYQKIVNGSNFNYWWKEIEAVPKSLYDTLDTKKTIFVSNSESYTPTIPYSSGDLWSQGTYRDGELMVCITERLTGVYTASDWTTSNNYSAIIQELADVIDGKITSYYQATAPHSEYTNISTINVNYSLYCSYEGDIWYDTDLNKSYRYTKTPNGSNFDFKWKETDGVPDSVYDAIDGKRQIFTTTPIVPYDLGDLWVQGVNGDIRVCIIAKTSVQSYSINDWSLASKYTDDSALEDFINDTYTGEISGLQNQIDGKVSYYWQSNLPHAEYTNIVDTVSYNAWVGDTWYNTTDTITYTYTKSDGATGGKFDYKWVETTIDIPQELYDTIDGKKTIYSSKPTAFAKDDIWLYEGVYHATTNPTSTLKDSTTPGVGYSQSPYVQGTSYTYFKKNDLLVATGDSATYNPALWKKYSSNIDKSNTNFSFLLNDDGVSISNGAINMTTANNTISLNPTDGFRIKKATADTFYLDVDGNIVMSGKITATSGAIANWTIGADTLASGNVGLYSGTTHKYTTNSIAKSIRIYAGGTLGATTDASGIPFVIDEDGRLKASSAYISGNIVMASGSKIGNWNVTATAIYNLKTTLASTTEGVYIGTDGISLGGATNYFKVTSAGALTATSANISGNITITGGTITWANVNKPTAAQVGALPDTTVIPTQYTDAEAVQAWVNSGYKTYINENGVYSGSLTGINVYGANYYSIDGFSKLVLVSTGSSTESALTLYKNQSMPIFTVDSNLLNTRFYGYSNTHFLTVNSNSTMPEGKWNFQFATVSGVTATAKFG